MDTDQSGQEGAGFGVCGAEDGAAHSSGDQDLVGVADEPVGFGVADGLAAAEVRVLELIPVADEPTVACDEVRADDDA